MAAARPAAGGGRWVEVAPERLQRWLDGFGRRHGPVVREEVPYGLLVRAEDGSVAEVHVPFPPVVGGLVEHVLRDRRVGVLLARLGGGACGVFDGPRLVASKITTRQVHGRSAAGGWSQQRFARRREGQARTALGAYAEAAAAVLLPHAGGLDGLVVGGERTAVDGVLEDPRLAPLRPLVTGRLLDVPDPRQVVLESSYALLRVVRIRVVDPPGGGG